MKRLYIDSMLTVMLFLTGCSTKLGEFTVLSSYNFEMQAPSELVSRDAKGSSMTTTVLVFIKVGKPDLKKAVEKALDEHDADFLTNARIYEKEWSALLFGQKGYVVEGFAFRTDHSGTTTGYLDNQDLVREDGLAYIPGQHEGEYELIGLDR